MYKARQRNFPIIQSLMDTDFYKLLMLQLIQDIYPTVKVKFSLIDRSVSLGFLKNIDEEELREQLDYARTLRFTKQEIMWLQKKTGCNQNIVFQEQFLQWLENFQLPEYELNSTGEYYKLEFSGFWMDSSLWEIPALSIVSELRARAAMKNLEEAEYEAAYVQAKSKLYSKIDRLKMLPDLRIADFGTRRRHNFSWQRWCVNALQENMGERFIGTSNVLLAMQENLKAVGTNGHELPMVFAALASDDKALRSAPYHVLEAWHNYYHGDMLIVLPDAFRTDVFLNQAPDWVKEWKGFRIDSGSALEQGERVLEWWRTKNVNENEKILIFSDSLNVFLIEKIQKHFHGKVKTLFGWGTNLTNDFENCIPNVVQDHKKDSLICKVIEANERNVVKLSDDPQKSIGHLQEIERYRKIFSLQ